MAPTKPDTSVCVCVCVVITRSPCILHVLYRCVCVLVPLKNLRKTVVCHRHVWNLWVLT